MAGCMEGDLLLVGHGVQRITEAKAVVIASAESAPLTLRAGRGREEGPNCWNCQLKTQSIQHSAVGH